MMTMQMERYGNDSMDKYSAIEEYCKLCQERRQPRISREEEMLEELLERSRGDFGRSVLANITGDVAYDILKVGIKGITKIL